MTRRNYSPHYDPDVTREDMGRPSRAEAERDAAEDRAAYRAPTWQQTPGPLTDAVRKVWGK